MVDENVLPEDTGTGAPYGDFDDAANYASMIHRPNAVDFVVAGLDLQPDYDEMKVYADAGRVVIEDDEALAVESEEVREFGVAYSAILRDRTSDWETNNDVLELEEGENYVFAAVNLDHGDAPYLYVNQESSGPSDDPSVLIGVVDVEAEEVHPENRYPSTEHQTVWVERDTDIEGDLEVEGETHVEGEISGETGPSDDQGYVRQRDTEDLYESAYFGDTETWLEEADFDNWDFPDTVIAEDVTDGDGELLEPEDDDVQKGEFEPGGDHWELYAEAEEEEEFNDDTGDMEGQEDGKAEALVRSEETFDVTGATELGYRWDNVGEDNGDNISRIGLLDEDEEWVEYEENTGEFDEDGGDDDYEVLDISDVDGEHYLAAMARDDDEEEKNESDLTVEFLEIGEQRLEVSGDSIRFRKSWGDVPGYAESPNVNPSNIDRWDTFLRRHDLDGGDVQYDILDTDDEVLFEDARNGEIIESLDPDETVYVRLKLWRDDDDQDPAVEVVTLTWIDRQQEAE